ncbi:MAG: VanW family protein [Clostridia bacterium]
MNKNHLKTQHKRIFKTRWIWLASICFIVVSALIIVPNVMLNGTKFFTGTKLEGIDVSGLTADEATIKVKDKISKNVPNLKFVHADKNWSFEEAIIDVDSAQAVIKDALKQCNTNGILGKIKSAQNAKNGYLQIQIDKLDLISGLNKQIEFIASELNLQMQEPQLNFDPNSKTPFTIIKGKNGLKVDKVTLKKMIADALNGGNTTIQIPTAIIKPTLSENSVLNNTQLRSNFYTSFENSDPGRRHNIKTAVSKLNGLKLQPGETVSFNNHLGEISASTGFQTAKIISQGKFVDGLGGGVCQVSTTLYNALLLGDLQVMEARKHSLPVNYVAPAFDAMVGPSSDLKFKNNTDFPIFIIAKTEKDKCIIQIYGKPFENNFSITQKSEIIREIKADKDLIIKDTNKEYDKKVTYKGEFLRIKNGINGYEAKGYIVKTVNGVSTTELVRHETYLPQNGILIEGTEDLMEGFSLPKET